MNVAANNSVAIAGATVAVTTPAVKADKSSACAKVIVSLIVIKPVITAVTSLKAAKISAALSVVKVEAKTFTPVKVRVPSVEAFSALISFIVIATVSLTFKSPS